MLHSSVFISKTPFYTVFREYKMRKLISLFFIMSLLSACGQKGPLVMPTKPAPVSTNNTPAQP
ncbi:lipoprotein [Undibacterium sp. YM2]|uniref:LPS translocon maturation chaperone LptM n=1 Tax=Undibacterium sp. YM2 TaxID=2058625 RepID=UPI00351AC834